MSMKCSAFVDTGPFGLEESTMGKTRAAYPPEFRRQIVELVRTGRSPEEADLQQLETDGAVCTDSAGTTIPLQKLPPS